MKTRLIILSVLSAAFAAVLAFAGFLQVGERPSAGPAPAPQAHLAATLQGFEPGSDVAYKLILPEGNAVSGHEQVGESGAINIPLPAQDQGTAAALTYNFSIQGKGKKQPVNLTFTRGPDGRSISVLGNGFDNFQPLEFASKGEKIRTKADWAGTFRDQAQWQPGDDESGAFKFALYQNNIASDAAQNPQLIKIFFAPGGGSANPAGGLVDGYAIIPPLEPPFGICETLAPEDSGFDDARPWIQGITGVMVPSVCDPCGSQPRFVGVGVPPSAPTPLATRLPGCTVWTMPPHNLVMLLAVQAKRALMPMEQASFNIMYNYDQALMNMSHQLAAAITTATWTLGPMLDAKEQLETQRQFQLMTAQAHKDYQPSDTMCRFGSFVKSIPRAEERAVLNKAALNSILMGTYTNLANRSSSEGYALDIEGRIQQFRRVYCDPRDNNDGLAYLCEHDQDQNLSNSTMGNAVPAGIGAVTPTLADNARKNKDIDYARTADFPLTLDIDFTDGVTTKDEEDVMALARNLYWPRALESAAWKELSTQREQSYMDARSLFAMENVAHNSFIEIAALKSRTDMGLGDQSGWNFMKSLMREFGLSDADINQYMGDYPSYYAQMEVLTKKIYQSPDFYTNLYDKPANVARISASLDAIRVMQQRDQLESRHRQEMLDSLMVEEALARSVGTLNAGMTTAIRDSD